MFLVDTNIISEARKGLKADPGVLAFLQTVDETELFIAVQTLGEIRRGVENIRSRGDAAQVQVLETWLDQVISEYVDRILVFDADCTQVWGRLMSPHPQHPIDKQIAAIALLYDLTVVTRNMEEYRGMGVRLRNPFVAGSGVAWHYRPD